MNHFISVADYSKKEIGELLNNADAIKKGVLQPRLNDKTLILLFFNPSLRTRTSFELAMKQLGGNVVTLNAGEDTWKVEIRENSVMDGSAAEHIKDAARVLGRYADAIAVRAFPAGSSWHDDKADPVISAFRHYAGVPIINMESSLYHPNQALADIMTIREEYGNSITRLPITITWAYHPNPLPMAVPNSILLTAALFGMDIRLIRPDNYDLDSEIMTKARSLCETAGGGLTITDSFEEGFAGSKVVYAKSWGSLQFYGKKEEERTYRKRFANWIVDTEKMARTDNAIFMHCLPVRRNVVVSDDVIDSIQSRVYVEAENRLHVQKAVLTKIFER